MHNYVMHNSINKTSASVSTRKFRWEQSLFG